MKLINSTVRGLDIEYCRQRKSGIIALKVSDENEKQQVLDRLNDNVQLATNYTAKLPQDKQLPKVTVTGISEFLFDDCGDDTEQMKSTLIDEILFRNKDLEKVVNGLEGVKEVLEVVMLKKVDHNVNSASYTAVLKVSAKLRHAIHLAGNKVFIYLNRCKVFDRYYLTQCYHCQRFGHTAENCEHEEPVCRYCGKNHESQSCDVKSNTDMHCCANCMSSPIQDHKDNAKGHIASNFSKCPHYKNCILRLKQNTVDWLPKNC